jgi:phosphatidylglycerophosphatase A
MNIFKYPLAYWIAVGLGSGLIRPAPGTWGSIVGLLSAWLLLALNFTSFTYFIFFLIAFLYGIYACQQASTFLGEVDHPSIVWDEIVGMWGLLFVLRESYGLFSLSWSYGWDIVALFVFRLFDILKPGLIGWCDRHIPGGFGVMCDDAVAALMAWLSMGLIFYIFA